MTDFSRIQTNRSRRVDPYDATVPVDAGIEAARMLRGIALFGIVTRLFYIYASANRISVTHALLGLLDANGKIDLNRQPNRGADLVAQGYDADALITIALVASLVALVLFVLALISISRRNKRGDAVAVAIHKNRAVRLAGRFYLVIAVSSAAARYAFNPNPDASPTDRLHTVFDADIANIGFQIAVIAILLIIALATGREIGKARAAGRIG